MGYGVMWARESRRGAVHITVPTGTVGASVNFLDYEGNYEDKL